MAFFQDGAGSKIYEKVRDNDFYSDARDRVEALRLRYEPLCRDPGFRRHAMVHFNALVWQMYLACVLLDHGHVLEPSGDDAPDLKIRCADGGMIWIEVTTAEAGEGENRAERIYQSDPSKGAAMYRLDERKMILRYQNALRAKAQHRERFIERGVIAAADAYVVAIDAADIDDADLDDGLPNIVRSVFPIGPLQIEVPIKMGDEPAAEDAEDGVRTSWAIQPSLPIPGKKDVGAQTTGFADGSFGGVSAIIFSPDAIWNAPIEAGRECITVYNATASVPIPVDTFKFDESFHGDGHRLHRRDWTKPAVGEVDGLK